ncbi:MAG: hypothetical protein AAGA80_20900 [Cyanobacteria bacterium P01_F01_bin.143]
MRLENLDAAAIAKNYTEAMKSHNKAVDDFDAYVQLVPKTENI